MAGDKKMRSIGWVIIFTILFSSCVGPDERQICSIVCNNNIPNGVMLVDGYSKDQWSIGENIPQFGCQGKSTECQCTYRKHVPVVNIME